MVMPLMMGKKPPTPQELYKARRQREEEEKVKEAEVEKPKALVRLFSSFRPPRCSSLMTSAPKSQVSGHWFIYKKI